MGNSKNLDNEVPLLKHLGPIVQLLERIAKAVRALRRIARDTEAMFPSTRSQVSLEQTLSKIAYQVVTELGYVGARIATLEPDHKTLRARAYFIDPDLLEISNNLSPHDRIKECERQIQHLEQHLSTLVGKQVGLKAPTAQVKLDDKQALRNLGVRAINSVSGPQIVTDSDLFTLFTPVLPDIARPAVRNIQNRLGIRQVAAVPLLVEGSTDGMNMPRFVGNLFIASRWEISDQEKAGLRAFAQRAAEMIELDQQLQLITGATLDGNKGDDQSALIPILFLSADPSDASRLRLGEEMREIDEKLRLAKLRDKFKLDFRFSVRPGDLSQALLDLEPRFVHFSGHGTATGALCVEDRVGNMLPINPDALAALFEQFSDQVGCVVFNACYSEAQARATARYVAYVIGMNQAIGDKAAIAFSSGFYRAIAANKSVEQAYKLGCVEIGLEGIPEHLTPVLVRKNESNE